MAQYKGVSGKRIFITGSTSGIGFAMAKALLLAGASVFITGRSADRIKKAISELGSFPGTCSGVELDVRNEQSIRSAVAAMVQIWGGIDVLINNAGIGMRTVNRRFLTDPQPFWKVSANEFRDVMETNLTGYFLVAKEIVPHLLNSRAGKIINVTVNHETMQRKGYVPYGPSRAGSEALSQVMARDLESYGVTVNLLLPGGPTDTGMVPDEFPDSKRGQLLSPGVMAEPVVFLCSDDAEGIHDQRINAKEFTNWKEQRNKLA